MGIYKNYAKWYKEKKKYKRNVQAKKLLPVSKGRKHPYFRVIWYINKKQEVCNKIIFIPNEVNRTLKSMYGEPIGLIPIGPDYAKVLTFLQPKNLVYEVDLKYSRKLQRWVIVSVFILLSTKYIQIPHYASDAIHALTSKPILEVIKTVLNPDKTVGELFYRRVLNMTGIALIPVSTYIDEIPKKIQKILKEKEDDNGF